MSERMPVIFFGHGNPMNALADNQYTQGWRKIGETIPRPKAILCISAHWYFPATEVTAMSKPPTIHDFGGFPRELFEFQYPASGNLELAKCVKELLLPLKVGMNENWGLDHGTWSVLCHVFPKADIPIIQLSIDKRQPSDFHYQLGKKLAPLREEGILIMGSGNLVHNLHAYAWGRKPVEPYDWAVRFEKQTKEFIALGNDFPLIDYEKLGKDAILSAPTPDHYLPLLYVLGARHTDDKATFPVEGMDGGSISMLTVQLD